MAAFTYIPQSASSKRFYVGATADLQRRLSEHARGHRLATRVTRSLETRLSGTNRVTDGSAPPRVENQALEISKVDSCFDRWLSWLERADLSARSALRARTILPFAQSAKFRSRILTYHK